MVIEDQCQKPTGDEGREVIKQMGERHRELTIWGLANIPKSSAKEILDIGCGGGHALKLLALKYPNAKCHGIDLSETCVEYSKEYNKFNIQWGKVDVQVASAENVPFPEKSMDLITGIETYFFWPNLEQTIAHVASRLKTGGVLCIISEQYFTPENHSAMEAQCVKYHMHLVENDEMVKIMEDAGLKANYILDSDKGWVTYLGVKE